VIQDVVRLTPEVYAKLEKQCINPVVTTQTTDLLAGFQLGVQHVLRLLREGYVISR
jgi:hypothetical protein